MSGSWKVTHCALAIKCRLPPLKIQNNVANRGMTWCEMKYKIMNNDLTFGRSEEMKRKYQEAVSRIKMENKTVDQRILEKEFGNTREKTILTPNEYPYYLQVGIRHDILWSRDKLSREIIEDFIKCSNKLKNRECLWFINAQKDKSVKSVEHAHIISRLKGSKCICA